VTFSIDADGILHVTAKDKATGKSASITIKETSRLTEEEIERMRREAEEHAEEDKRRAEAVEVRNRADQLVYSTEKALNELGDKVSQAKRAEIEDQIRRLKEKLSQNASVDELRRAMEELTKSAQQLGAEAYKQASSAQTGGTSSSSDDKEPQPGDYVDAEYEDKDDNK